jgi:ATP-binding cassette subfamily F protein uup
MPTGATAPRAAVSPAPTAAAAPAAPAKRKLGFKEQRELDQLPATIDALEKEVAAATAALNDPAMYQRGAAEVQAANRALAEVQARLDAAYARWAELE